MNFLKDIGLRLQIDEGGMVGDLNKDGKMSGYEQARQDAIEENMREQKQEGGPMESEMNELMPTANKDMVPDEDMEDINENDGISQDDFVTCLNEGRYDCDYIELL